MDEDVIVTEAPPALPVDGETAVSPRTAALQVLAVLLVLVPVFALAQSSREAGWLTSLHESASIVVGVGLMGLLALSVTWLVMRSSREGWASAHAARPKLGQTLLFGAIAAAGCYGAAMFATLIYLVLTGFDVEALLKERGEVLEVFAGVPLALVLPLALFVGIYEELLFRGFFLSRARRALSPLGTSAAPVVALILVSTLFGAAHAYQGPLGVLQTGAIGFVLGAVTLWRRSLWPCVVAHAIIDTVGLVAVKFLKPLLDSLEGSLP